MHTVERVLMATDKGLSVKPDFAEHGVYFYPLPKGQQDDFLAGDKVKGHYGRCYDSKKRDKRGKPIYIRYFIVEEKL